MLHNGISIIIPTYNEEVSIATLIRQIDQSLKPHCIAYEIILIDDHSTDDTVKIVSNLAKTYPIQMYLKEGRSGMGYSVLEGFVYSRYENIAVFDADGHYSPKYLPDLLRLAMQFGYSIGERPKARVLSLFAIWHRFMDFFTTQVILGLPAIDIESGLKVFKREIFTHLDEGLISSWSIDVPLVYTAQELGFKGSSIVIDYAPRNRFHPLMDRIKKRFARFGSYLKTGLATRRIYPLPAPDGTMIGSGVSYRRGHFVTHSTLSPNLSALRTFVPWQILAAMLIVTGVAVGIVVDPIPTFIFLTSILSFIYLLDVIFNFVISLKSLHFSPVIKIDEKELKLLIFEDLPTYTVLCPLYKEASVLPLFVKSMTALNWPTEKLEILLLLEADDTATIKAAQAMSLPPSFKIIIVPDSNPKTKPKACNYGLSHATGKYVVIFDAEDQPDPMQLKIAYLAFQQSQPRVVCLQAKLNYYNPKNNLLTRLFTSEYSLWFDVILPGLQSINTTIPLGGTSNHFRTEKLRELQGWDAFNVTEDCDLGARLFNAGYQTSIIDSTTFEEANSNFKNWIRQRSRWLKGYMQTYLVHTRNPLKLIRDQGWHSLVFQLIVGGKISFILINPLLWAMTISYFVARGTVGAMIESIYPAPVFYIAITSLLFGNFLALYNYMIGCAKRGHWDLVKYIFLIPLYWLAISWAAGVALIQLITKPHYWEKTIHGLHLNKSLFEETKVARGSSLVKVVELARTTWSAGGVMIFATFFANIMNFIYNAHLSRHLSLADFGDISLFGSFLYLASVPITALGRTVTHTSAFLLGKYGYPVKEYWQYARPRVVKVGILASILWLLFTPLLMGFFHVDNWLPFVLFAPVWAISALGGFDSGFLGGNLLFNFLALSLSLEAFSKFLFASAILDLNQNSFVYAAIPLSMLLPFLLTWWATQRIKAAQNIEVAQADKRLDWRFFFSSILTNLGNITFLSLDLVLAKHYLSPELAGAYSYISLAGKMVYFLGGVFSQFLIPYLSRDLGAGKNTTKTYTQLFYLIAIVNTFAFIVFGWFGKITAPLLWGANAVGIVTYLPMYCLAMALFSLTNVVVTYGQIRSRHLFPVVAFVFGSFQILGMLFFHQTISNLVTVVAVSSFASLIGILLLSKYYQSVIDLYNASLDLIGLFGALPAPTTAVPGKLRILIFNWRDTKHKWGGGAETYLHELSKRFVLAGHEVTIFCGSDGHSPSSDNIDGVTIIRRGGFYLVYFWAFVYYMLRLRNHYDVIIDSENGIPFFTPLYVRERVYLLIHHVHQEVFRTSLIPPFSYLAAYLEKKVMPQVYRHTEVLTVSPSSKAEILLHELTTRDPSIIYNGVDLTKYKPGKKNLSPMVLYLGRLTTAKSINVLLHSAKTLIAQIPKVEVVIAGDGPAKNKLQKLASSLGINQSVTFLGKVSESDKIRLYQRAWVFVNPSLIEGWGITTIEANACGTPVVASNVAGLRDAVHNPHSGLLVPYGKVQEFATAIAHLLTDTNARRHMSQESVIWAKQFDWDKSALEALKIIQQSKAKI